MTDSVGTLLAAIATLISASLVVLARSRAQQPQDQWGPDEHEQVRALETALDEAKRDFQELAPLVNGQDYYEHDRIPQSLAELRGLRDRFAALADNFEAWAASGGSINPIWTKETIDLRRELHRAQCRAAQRIFAVDHDAGSAIRCLGAFIVYRKQRAAARRTLFSSSGSPPLSRPSSLGGAGTTSTPPPPPTTRRTHTQRTSEPPPARTRRSRSGSIPRRDYRVPSGSHHASLDEERPAMTAARQARLQARVEELMACNRVGRFERHGDCDLAFVCDFCDGHIVWEDLERMPTTRTLDDLDVEGDGDRSSFSSGRQSSFSGQQSSFSPGQQSYNSGRMPSPPVPPRYQPHKRTETMGTNISITSNTSRISMPVWRATGFSQSSHTEKGIVFAPVAIANHTAPSPREWMARILCPVCDVSGGQTDRRDSTLGTIEDEVEASSNSGEDDDGEWDENGFEDLGALQEHLEWAHAGGGGAGGGAGAAGSCCVM